MAGKLHRNALQPGYQVLWYRIDRILGQGGFGITYLAHDPNLDQQVAIKEYLPIELAVREKDYSVHPVSEDHGGNYAWGLERFITEARTLARFDHPNIVRVLSVFEQNNTAYMVMRYEHGTSLQDLLPRRGTLEEDQLLKILFPVLGGLREVHEAGFIHRDIKPANVFVREDGSPVLLDFGSARQALGRETKTLTTLVSPGFAPFEQYYSKSDRQGPWTDIYGLGATLYRAVTGVAPMDALDRSEGLLKESKDPYIRAVDAATGRYSQRFLAAIDHALSFSEEKRPQDVAEWLTELEVPDAPTIVAGPRETEPARTDAVHPSGILPTDTDAGGAGTGVTTEDEAGSPGEKSTRDDGTGEAYRRFIGPQHQAYYLNRFQSFDKRGGGWLSPSWNWPAALLTFYWFLYRRMLPWAFPIYPLVTAAITFVVLVPIGIGFFGGGDIPPRVAVPVLLLVSILWPGTFGNAIYYHKAKSRIAGMQRQNLDHAGNLAWLESRGGTSRRALISGIVLTALLVLMATVDKAHKKQAEKKTRTEPRVEMLLEEAREDYRALRLSTPPGDNALEKVRAALELDPENQAARKMRRAIVEKYVELSKVAAERKELRKAETYLDRALEIAPHSEELQGYWRRLEKIKAQKRRPRIPRGMKTNKRRPGTPQGGMTGR